MKKIEFRAIAIEEIETSTDSIQIGDIIYGYLLPENKIKTLLTAECGGVGSGLVWVECEINPDTIEQYPYAKTK